MANKVAITLSVDKDVKDKAMKIIQQKLGGSVSAYVNDRFIELVQSHKHQYEDDDITKKEVKDENGTVK